MGYNKILITGTPGVGKTTLSQYLKKMLGYKVVGLSDLIEKKKLYNNKCATYDTLEYNPAKVEKYLRKKLSKKKSYIFDTHDPESVFFIEFDVIIVLSADIYVLGERYNERGYNKIKADENIQVEIMEVIYNEVIDSICKNDEEIKNIIRVETVKDKKPKTVEEIYKEIAEAPAWKKVIAFCDDKDQNE